jgi:hypothetical protein
MTPRLARMLTAAGGRYPTPDERQALLDFAESLPRRVKAAELVEQTESAVVRGVIEEMQRRYPNFARYHEQGWDKVGRDLELVVRHDAQAVLADDPELLDEKVLVWLRTVLAALNITSGFVRDAFTLLRDGFRAALPAEAFGLLEPALTRNIEVTSDFPEPATPAV